MRTSILLVLTVALSACSKGKPSSSGIASQVEKPANCSFVSNGTHQFRGWGTQAAAEYLCEVPEAEGMDCYFYEGADGAKEMNCLADSPAQVTADMSSCVLDYVGGSRSFFEQGRTFSNGNLLGASSAYCGQKYGMHCWYYYHPADSDDSTLWQDLQCTEY